MKWLAVSRLVPSSCNIQDMQVASSALTSVFMALQSCHQKHVRILGPNLEWNTLGVGVSLILRLLLYQEDKQRVMFAKGYTNKLSDSNSGIKSLILFNKIPFVSDFCSVLENQKLNYQSGVTCKQDDVCRSSLFQWELLHKLPFKKF